MRSHNLNRLLDEPGVRDGGCTGNSFCSSAGVMNRRGAWGVRQPTGVKRHCNACVLLSRRRVRTAHVDSIYRTHNLLTHVRDAHPTFLAVPRAAWILPRSTACLKRRFDIGSQPCHIFISIISPLPCVSNPADRSYPYRFSATHQGK